MAIINRPQAQGSPLTGIGTLLSLFPATAPVGFGMMGAGAAQDYSSGAASPLNALLGMGKAYQGAQSGSELEEMRRKMEAQNAMNAYNMNLYNNQFAQG